MPDYMMINATREYSLTSKPQTLIYPYYVYILST